MAVFDVFNPLQNITPRFTEEQLNEIVEWFDTNSKPLLVINNGEPINVISIEQLIDFFKLKKFHRRSFHYPTYGEIMREADELKAGQLRVITKEQFIYMLNKWVLETTLRHELMLAFKIFDTEKRDFLDVEEIQSIVTSYGDVFSEAETREMVRDANVSGNGNVFYEEFIETLFNVAPQLNNIEVDYLYDDPDEDPSVPPEPEPELEPEPEPEPPPVVEAPPPPPPVKEKAKKKK